MCEKGIFEINIRFIMDRGTVIIFIIFFRSMRRKKRVMITLPSLTGRDFHKKKKMCLIRISLKTCFTYILRNKFNNITVERTYYYIIVIIVVRSCDAFNIILYSSKYYINIYNIILNSSVVSGQTRFYFSNRYIMSCILI